MDNLHQVLIRQIKKKIGNLDSISKEYFPLFAIISDTYKGFDDDRILVERSLDLSSKELSEYSSLLKSTLESIDEGILVVDNKGVTTTFNQKFVTMWKIPEEIIKTHNDNKFLDYVFSELKTPEVFINKVKELYSKPELEGSDSLELKDGRIFDRYSKPQYIGEKIVGRVWSFKDVTDQRSAEIMIKEKLLETEKMNHFMIDRELKIVELKAEISRLKTKPEKIEGSV